MNNDLYRFSAKKINELFLKDVITATEIAEYYLSRIESHNGQLGAFLQVLSERVLQKAKRLDQKKKENKPLGKLAGIPIAIKDNIHIENQITTCGSAFLENYVAPFDATVVRLLEQEDALLIGKTNLDEFAMGSSTENSAFFPTRNPWDLTCTPGGSSGGSAASVAARLCPISLGSDTGGSIRQPAAFTKTVGFKPTYGRVSRYGLVAFASSLDQIGPIANYCEDIGLIMEVIGSCCEKDATSLNLPNESYQENIPASFENITVGIPSNFIKNLGKENKAFQDSIHILKSLNAHVIDIDLDVLKHSIATYYILATAEASTNLARFDGIRYGNRSSKAKTIDEVYKFSRQEGFGKEVKSRIMLGTYVLSAGHKAHLYMKAQKLRQMIIDAFDKAFSTCDFIVLPTSPSSAFTIGSLQDPLDLYFQDIFTICANLAGIPAISIPSGFDNHQKPLGIQIMGPQLHDVAVVKYATVLEKAFSIADKIPPLFDREVNRG